MPNTVGDHIAHGIAEGKSRNVRPFQLFVGKRWQMRHGFLVYGFERVPDLGKRWTFLFGQPNRTQSEMLGPTEFLERSARCSQEQTILARCQMRDQPEHRIQFLAFAYEPPMHIHILQPAQVEQGVFTRAAQHVGKYLGFGFHGLRCCRKGSHAEWKVSLTQLLNLNFELLLEIHEQYVTRAITSIPRFMLQRVIEYERFARCPGVHGVRYT